MRQKKLLNEISEKLNLNNFEKEKLKFRLRGHGYPEAIKENQFSWEKISNRKIKVNYYYKHPSNFTQSEWVKKIMIVKN